MTGHPELSRYPDTETEEQLRLAERLSRPREDLFDAFGKIAIGAVMTGGVVEPTPANIESRERHSSDLSEVASRKLAGNALASTITLRTDSVDQALAWQLARERALRN